MTPPDWLEALMHAVCRACVSEVRGRMSGFSFRWAEPDGNPLGTWLLQIAPAVVEVAGGREDGAVGYDGVDADLLALPGCLDAVESFAYDPGLGGEEPHLTLDGRLGGRQVTVEVYFEPFEGDEAQTIFDANLGGWREKEPERDE
jgi:hypothetical protein